MHSTDWVPGPATDWVGESSSEHSDTQRLDKKCLMPGKVLIPGAIKSHRYQYTRSTMICKPTYKCYSGYLV